MTTTRSFGADDLDLHLPHPDRLDDDHAQARRAEEADGVGYGEGEPAEVTRVAIDRMNTVGSSACWLMRTRSPRMAPPQKGDVGSTASTATGSPASSAAPRAMRLSVSVDFPAPGAPVSPTE